MYSPGRIIKVDVIVTGGVAAIPVMSATVTPVGGCLSVQTYSHRMYEELAQYTDGFLGGYQVGLLGYDLTVLAENREDGSFVVTETESMGRGSYDEVVYTLQPDGSKITEYFQVTSCGSTGRIERKRYRIQEG